MFQNNLLMGAAAAASGGASVVSVGNSALYNTANTEYLSRTPSGAGTSTTTWTMSFWVYRSRFGGSNGSSLFGCTPASNTTIQVYFTTSDTLKLHYILSTTDKVVLETTQVFRDIGWYHICVVADTSNAVANNRVRFIVNGERVTAFSTETQNSGSGNNIAWNSASTNHVIGAILNTSSALTWPADSYFAEVVFLDGTASTNGSEFGAYDSSGLYWTPLSSETIKELTFGTNGFYLSNEYDVSSNMTTFVDSGPTAHTITTVNDATHSPLGQKVQNSVIYVDGTDWIKTAQSGHADFTFGTGDFCIEGWFNRIALSGTSNYSYIFDFRYSGGNTLRPACYMTNLNTLVYAVGATTGITASTNAVVGTWFNVAIARSGSTTTMYLNGTSVGSFTDNTDYASGRPWFFQYPQSNAYGFTGYGTELRISKGVPRYTGNFTPSTTAFVSDSDTSLLVHSNKFFGAANDSNTPPNNFINNNTVTTSTHTLTNISALLNPLSQAYTSGTVSIGSTRYTGAGAYMRSGLMTSLPCDSGGKWYWETRVAAIYTTNAYSMFGVSPSDLPRTVDSYATSPGNTNFQGGQLYFSGSSYTLLKANAAAQNDNVGASMTVSVGSIVQLAFDSATQKLWYGINNTWYNSGNPATGANPSSTFTATDKTWYPWFAAYTSSDILDINMGTNPTFNGAVTAQNNADGNGYGNFYYAPPTGFLAINTANIASETTRTASDVTKYFQTVLYEGNGAGQRVGAFQPFTDTFTVAKSALFDSANSETLTRTPSGAGNRRTWTFSTWIKFAPTTGSFTIFNGYGSASDTGTLDIFWSSNKIYLRGWSTNYVYSSMLFEDESQWGNLVMTLDTTQSTSSDRIKGYWNGVELTWGGTSYPSLDAQLGINQAVLHSIGAFNNASGFMGAYLAETVFVDGAALTASSFGQTDTSTNRWIPKAVSGLSLGTNGFYLDYSNSSDLGEDQTGSNDFTNNNTVTQSTDSPTTNFAVLDANQPAWTSAVTLSAGNLTFTGSAASIWNNVTATLPMTSGKWIVATKPNAVEEGEAGIILVNEVASRSDADVRSLAGVWGFSGGGQFASGAAVKLYMGDGSAETDVNTGVTLTTSDYNLLCVDVDNKLYWIGYYDDSADETKWYNGSSGWDGDPAAGTGGIQINGNSFKFGVATYATRGGIIDFGQGTLLSAITVPTGFSYLKQDNLASTDQFISAFSWIKNRDATDNHMLFDRVRGVTKDIHSNTADIEVTNSQTVQQFLSAGVQIGDDVQVNTANESYALWNWMMEATGSGSSNEDGTINTTATLVDTTLGMSISTYTGTGSNATVGHGLGVVPECMIVKRLNSTFAWQVYHSSIGNTKFLSLDNYNAATTRSTVWNNTTPTSSVFSIGTDGAVNASGGTYVVYCFNPSQFISIGSYTNNNNADGPFVPTLNSLGVPIQPVWIMAKTNASASWIIIDNKRIGYNVDNNNLLADTTVVESTADKMDIVTGGFKLRTNLDPNYLTATTVYIAIGTPIIDTDGRIIAGR